MGGARGPRQQVAVGHVEGAGEFENRVVAFFRHRTVGCPAASAQGGPCRAFGFVDDGHVGWFADHGEAVVAAELMGELLRSPLTGFLAHEGDEVDGHRQAGEVVAVFVKRPEHGSHRAFGVAGTASPDFAVTDIAAEWFDRHAADADGIKVRAEQHARSAVDWCEARDQVRSAGFDFFERHAGAD